MRIPKIPHAWNVTPKQAVAIQKKLAQKIKKIPLKRPVRLVAGVDSAFSKDEKYCIAAVTLWDIKKKKIVEQKTATAPLKFPYIPGFLSFRETPALLNAFKKIRKKPDLIMCDGHGLAHPRRFGIACHIGILLNIPSLGCGKSRLIGRYEEPNTKKGSLSPLVDKNEVVGSLVRTRDGVRPVFISIGHKITLKEAEKISLRCSVGYRLPEPTRQSDILVAKTKRESFQ